MLQKGFLKRKYSLSITPRRIWQTMFIAVGYSVAIYAFMVCMREGFRWRTFKIDYDYLLILTPHENFFYNFFFAILATLTGFSVAMEGLIKTQFHLPGFIRHSITNDQTSLQWLANYWIAKLGSFYAVLYLAIASRYDYNGFDFYRDYWFLFPSILIVLFLNQWMKFRLFLKADSSRWMGYSSIAILLFSVMLAFLPIVDYQGLNHAILKNTPSYNYKIDLPKSSVAKFSRRSLTAHIYIGFPKNPPSDSAVLSGEGSISPMTLVDFNQWLSTYQGYLPDNERSLLEISIRSDRHVKMGMIKKIVDIMRYSDIRKVKLVTLKNGWGIPYLLTPRCQEFSDDILGLTISCKGISRKLKKKSTFHFSLKNDSIKSEGQSFSNSDLAIRLKHHIESYPADYLIELQVDNESYYETYVSLMDVLFSTFIELKDKAARERCGRPYKFDADFENDPELEKYVRKLYPMNIIQLSDKDWEYLELKTPTK